MAEQDECECCVDECTNTSKESNECAKCGDITCDACWIKLFRMCKSCKSEVLYACISYLRYVTTYCSSCDKEDGENELDRRYDKMLKIDANNDGCTEAKDGEEIFYRVLNKCKNCQGVLCHVCMDPNVYLFCRSCRKKRKHEDGESGNPRKKRRTRPTWVR